MRTVPVHVLHLTYTDRIQIGCLPKIENGGGAPLFAISGDFSRSYCRSVLGVEPPYTLRCRSCENNHGIALFEVYVQANDELTLVKMDQLQLALSGLRDLDLTSSIVEKQTHPSSSGGSSDVYRARSKKHERNVAVKVLRTFILKNKEFAAKVSALH